MAIKKYNADGSGKDAVPLRVIDAAPAVARPANPQHQPAPEQAPKGSIRPRRTSGAYAGTSAAAGGTTTRATAGEAASGNDGRREQQGCHQDSQDQYFQFTLSAEIKLSIGLSADTPHVSKGCRRTSKARTRWGLRASQKRTPRQRQYGSRRRQHRHADAGRLRYLHGGDGLHLRKLHHQHRAAVAAPLTASRHLTNPLPVWQGIGNFYSEELRMNPTTCLQCFPLPPRTNSPSTTLRCRRRSSGPYNNLPPPPRTRLYAHP